MPGAGFVHRISALCRTAARGRDEFAEIAPALQIARQRHDLERTPDKFAAMDQMQAAVFGRLMGTHGAGDRTLIGQGQCRITQAFGAMHQLGRRRGATQKAEAGQAVQLCIGQRPSARALRHG